MAMTDGGLLKAPRVSNRQYTSKYGRMVCKMSSNSSIASRKNGHSHVHVNQDTNKARRRR